MTAANEISIQDIIEYYSGAPDFYGKNISDVNSRTSFGDQLIHAACVAGNLNHVDMLLKLSADINSKGEVGYTPLHYASEQGYVEIVKFLLAQGADPAIRNSDDETAYELALVLSRLDVQLEFKN